MANVVLGLLLCLSLPARAEIYRWVDDQGNVHFGDKPKQAEEAAEARPVEVQEAYPVQGDTSRVQPGVPSAESIAARRERDRKREEEEDAARRARADAIAAKCDEWRDEYRRITGVQLVAGRPTVYYLTDEDGKSVSAEEQRAYAAKLKAHGAKNGCDPF